MAIYRIKTKNYSDVDYVVGVYNRVPLIERALYHHCERYFNENYQGVFFIGKEYKYEIFHESFIKLWENIRDEKIYAEDGQLYGKNGKLFTSTLTTYFMAIARLKYLEWVREHRKILNTEDEDKVCKTIDLESYKDILYDESDNRMLEIIADCISHMSERCNQILTLFYYKEKTLDDIMIELPTFDSKNALKTAKYKCMETLRMSAKSIYQKYIDS